MGIKIRKNWEHDADYLQRIGCTLQPDEIHAATYHICYNGKHTGIGFDVYVKSDGSVRMFIEDAHKSISTNFPRSIRGKWLTEEGRKVIEDKTKKIYDVLGRLDEDDLSRKTEEELRIYASLLNLAAEYAKILNEDEKV